MQKRLMFLTAAIGVATAIEARKRLRHRTGILAEYGPDAKVLAGGQSLVPLLALRLSHPEHLVDIGRVDRLASVDDGPAGFTVGAGARHAAVELSPLTGRAAPLVAAAMPHI